MRAPHFAIALCLAAFSFTACNADDGTTPTTTAATTSGAPVIQSVDATNQGNGIVTLRVKASDPNNSQLKFLWHTNDGQLSATTAAAVQWKLPSQPGTYSVAVDVTNAKGLKTTGTQQFTVGANGEATAANQLQTATTATGSGINPLTGQFDVPQPLGSSAVAPPIVAGNPQAAPFATSTPTLPLVQPVATPAPLTNPIPSAPPIQPIATPTPTQPPLPNPPSPLPTPQPPTPQPGVPVPPPVRWVQYDPGLVPANVNFTSLFFLNDTMGWLVGAGSAVLQYNKTDPNTNPGLVFRNALVPPSTQIDRVFFTSKDHGFISGEAGLVMRTLDGGQTWQDISVPKGTASELVGMVVYNDQIVVVGDSVGRVFRSESANAADPTQVFWTTEPAKPQDRPGDQAQFLTDAGGFQTDTSVTYFVGDGIYKLDADNPDPTKIWTKILQLQQPDPIKGTLGDGQATRIKLVSQNDIWVGTINGNLLRSADGGATWTRLPRDQYKDREHNGNALFLTPPDGIRAISRLDANNAFLGTGASRTYDTTDAGVDWRQMITPNFTDLQIWFNVANGTATMHGFGVGSGGTFYEYRGGP